MVQFVMTNYLKTAKVEFNDINNNTNNSNKKQLEENEVVDKEENIPNQEEKFTTLKQRIREDSKRLDEKEMKKQGMI